MELISRPTARTERVEVVAQLGARITHMGKSEQVDPAIIYSPMLSEEERTWAKLKSDHCLELRLGEKVDKLEFKGMILYGVLPYEMVDDIFTCAVDYYTIME